MNDWAVRPLDETYAAILIDAIVVKVRDGPAGGQGGTGGGGFDWSLGAGRRVVGAACCSVERNAGTQGRAWAASR